MDRSVEHIELTMFRPDLKEIPDVALPDGFSLRLFRDGDPEHWVRIEMSAGEFRNLEEGRTIFHRDFGNHIPEMKRRSFFLEANGVGPIGTTSAWWGGFRGESIGMIHWVAISPDFQGRGLSTPMVSAALSLLSKYHESAHLHTQTASWRAVGLYQKLGFQRVDESDDEHRGWAIVDECLARPR